MQIIPAILEQNFADAEKKIKLVTELTRWIQIDIIDGYLTKGKTFELELLTKLEHFGSENILWDMHLMVKEPIKWINKCNFAGAARIIGQVEMMSDREEFVKEIKDMGMEAGLAFDIDTRLDSDIPDDTDLVLLMGRKLGFEKQQINKDIWDKIEQLKQIRKDKDLQFAIGIDGGIDENNLPNFVRTGIGIGYCTGAVYNGNVDLNWKKLESLL